MLSQHTVINCVCMKGSSKQIQPTMMPPLKTYKWVVTHPAHIDIAHMLFSASVCCGGVALFWICFVFFVFFVSFMLTCGVVQIVIDLLYVLWWLHVDVFHTIRVLFQICRFLRTLGACYDLHGADMISATLLHMDTGYLQERSCKPRITNHIVKREHVEK